ncbi:Malonyl CoA-acyl carrier protein transacylase [Acidisarcina polymorpha]|uniref:Malonyl CoA-acyl carrier protein transacylase n=1 Tax=Acidisarcina polymorpha TaxID=2211140 RepID=A0A2Z5FY32_9BACT|nr:ACP S-malonyltransferase [Acidisarcina polymorpha]AXC11295.1 Malonyl CoA-acyl carrier protein transacylase [Acidisarcina polymorpha]
MIDKKLAFLFPGQGSQSVGMGHDLYENFPVARQTFEEADDVLGFSLSKLCFEGPEEELRLTENTQPAIFTVSVAAQRVLAEKGVTPSYAAGHSLGEYSANVAAGAITFADGVETVRERGRYMQEAVPAGKGAMAAILGMAADEVLKACVDASAETGEIVATANINSPSQIVVSGTTTAVERAIALAKERGARKAVLLAVSAPFHCPLMQPAQDRLAVLLKEMSFTAARIPVVVNVGAVFSTEAEALRDALIRQVTGAVRWVESMQLLIAEKPDLFLEVGPGKVLSGLVRQIDREQQHAHVQDAATLNHAIEMIAGA